MKVSPFINFVFLKLEQILLICVDVLIGFSIFIIKDLQELYYEKMISYTEINCIIKNINETIMMKN